MRAVHFCESCKYSTYHLSNFVRHCTSQRHNLNHHNIEPDKNNKMSKCKVCYKYFYSKKKLLRHLVHGIHDLPRAKYKNDLELDLMKYKCCIQAIETAEEIEKSMDHVDKIQLNKLETERKILIKGQEHTIKKLNKINNK